MGYAGGVNSPVASICPIRWTIKLVDEKSDLWIFGKNLLRDDTWGLPSRGSFFSQKNTFLVAVSCIPSRGSFFSKKACPFSKNTSFRGFGSPSEKKVLKCA